MNRGVFQSTSVQQAVGGRPGWWSLNSMRSSPQQISPILPSSSSSFASSAFPHPYAPPSSGLSSTLCHDIQERAESWSQLLLGEYVGEEESCNFNSFQPKVENWYHRAPNMVGVKHESSEVNACVQYPHGNHEEIQHADAASYSWSQHMLPVSSSPRSSCITSFGSNMLDFSNIKSEGKHPNPDHSSECNGPGTGGSAFKKARIQTCSPHSTFKVRKEKLGDRITVLHQLVSPFGKTDTASVLLEAIGYIRFLQGQIEALSSPYMRNASATSTRFGQGEKNCIFPEEPGQLLNDACMKRRETCEQKDAGQDEPKKDLRSRGLCLVPLSCTMHVGSDNGADYWAPAFSGGGFQ